MRHVRIVVLGIFLLAVAAASVHAAGPCFEPHGVRPDCGANGNAAGPYYEPNGIGPYSEPNGIGPYSEPNGIGPYSEPNGIGLPLQVRSRPQY